MSGTGGDPRRGDELPQPAPRREVVADRDAAWDERGWAGHASGRQMLFRIAAESVLRLARTA